MKISLLQRNKPGRLFYLNLSFLVFMQLQGLLLNGFSLTTTLPIWLDCLVIGTAVTICEIFLFPYLLAKATMQVTY
jgi:hypothetical protein